MTLDRETAVLSAQKLRLMRKGNIVVLVSLISVLINAVLTLIFALDRPISFYIGGGATVMLVLMFIGAIAMLIGHIMYLVGMYGMGQVRPEYHKAFLVEIVLIILGIVYNALGKEGFLAEIVSVLRNLGLLVVLWLVLQGTRSLLEGLGRETILRRGRRVWKLYVLAELISVILIFIPMPEGLETLTIAVLTFAVVIAVLGVVVAVDYIGYLGQAADALEQADFSLDREGE